MRKAISTVIVAISILTAAVLLTAESKGFPVTEVVPTLAIHNHEAANQTALLDQAAHHDTALEYTSTRVMEQTFLDRLKAFEETGQRNDQTLAYTIRRTLNG